MQKKELILPLLVTLLAFSFFGCAADVAGDTALDQSPDATSEGITATVVLPDNAGTAAKTIEVNGDIETAVYAVSLGGQTKDVARGAGNATFTGLSVGSNELTVIAYKDAEKAVPIEFFSETVAIAANSDNTFEAQLDFIYSDVSSKFSTDQLKGTVSLPIDWSETGSTSVRYIQLIDNTQAEGANVLAEQEIDSGATRATFAQQVGVTAKKGLFVHFRFLDAERKELGTSGMEVLRAAANQTSSLYDPLDEGNVSTLTLSSSALNESKGVTSAALSYTGTPGELKLTWTMPGSYSGVKIRFYPESDITAATEEKISKADLASFSDGSAYARTYDGLTAGTTYYAELCVLHDDDGTEYESGVTTVSWISPVILTGLAINDLSGNQVLQKGRTVTFTKTATPSDATDLGYTWSSSDEGILSTEDAEAGVFRVKGLGKATITVRADAYDNVSASRDFTVTLGQVKNVAVRANTASLQVSWSAVADASSYTVRKYEDGSLVKTLPGIADAAWEDAELKTGVSCQYTVQANGTAGGTDVSGLTSEKSAAFTAAEPTVTIRGATPTQVVANASQTGSTELVKGGSFTIGLESEVEGISSYKWYLNGESVDDGTVHTSGLDQITVSDGTPGLNSSKAGQVQYLTVVMSDGTQDYSATYQFTYVSVPVTDIVLDSVPSEIRRGDTVQLKAHVEPLDADVTTYAWTSSNTALATVDADGYVTVSDDMSAFSDSERTVTFTATSTSNADVTAVSGAVTLIAPVTGIEISADDDLLFVNGENGFGTEQLSVAYLPADASSSEKVVTGAYSSDDGIATIDSSTLLVTAVGAGHPAITVEGKNGTSATWEPTVLQGHILEYKSLVHESTVFGGDIIPTSLNRYVEGSTVDTTGCTVDGNTYYFRVVYSDSNSETPDESSFQDLANYGIAISYAFTDGETSHFPHCDISSADDNYKPYSFIILRKANAYDYSVKVTVTRNGTEFETLNFSVSP